MRRLRRFAGVMLTLVVALTVLLWPTGPAWRVNTPAHAVAFTRDSKSLVVVSASPSEPVVTRHIAATGREQSRAVLDGLPTVSDLKTAVSPDGARLLVYLHRTEPLPGGPDFLPGWWLFDTITGRCLVPYRPLLVGLVTTEFLAADGRFVVSGERRVGDRDELFHEVRDAADGTLMAAVKSERGEHPRSVVVRDDGTAAAVSWLSDTQGWDGVKTRIELIDLSTSGARRSFVPNPDGRYDVSRWSGSRLTLLRVGPRYSEHIYDLTAVPVEVRAAEWGLPRMDSEAGHWGWVKDGNGWEMERNWREFEGRPLQRLSAWAEGVGVWRHRRLDGTEQRLRFVDPETRAVRYELPTWLPIDPVVSHDGRWVAARSRGGVEVWSTVSPWPRWPIALLAAAAVLAVAFRRSRNRPPVQQPACGTPSPSSASA